MKTYKGYGIKESSDRYTHIFKDGKFIKRVDSVSSAMYIIDKDWI